VCNWNALLTYFSFLWVLQVFSLIHVFRLPFPGVFFVPPTMLHTSCTPFLRAEIVCAVVCVCDQLYTAENGGKIGRNRRRI